MDNTGEAAGRDHDNDRPTVVREDDVTQGTEVAGLPYEENPVDEGSEDSFPASDPPAYPSRADAPVEPRDDND